MRRDYSQRSDYMVHFQHRPESPELTVVGNGQRLLVKNCSTARPCWHGFGFHSKHYEKEWPKLEA